MSERERFDRAFERDLVDRAARMRQRRSDLRRAFAYALLAAALAVTCTALVVMKVGPPW